MVFSVFNGPSLIYILILPDYREAHVPVCVCPERVLIVESHRHVINEAIGKGSGTAGTNRGDCA